MMRFLSLCIFLCLTFNLLNNGSGVSECVANDVADSKVIELGRGYVSCTAALSPDGKTIVTGDADGIIRFWEIESGKNLMSLEVPVDLIRRLVYGVPAGSIGSIAFSPDGHKFVTSENGDGTKYSTIQTWDTESGKSLNVSLKLKKDAAKGCTSVAFSPDGKKFVTADFKKESVAQIWDAETGKNLAELVGHSHSQPANSAFFSPCGKKVVTASADHTARIWDATSGKELQALKGHRNQVYYATFSPDSKRIVTGSLDHTARIWDAESGQELREMKGHEGAVEFVAFSQDGKKIATAGYDQTARIWDAETGKELRKLEGHAKAVFFVAFMADDKRIITAGRDHTIRIWTLE